jgi:hypothetical protein
MRFDPEQHWLSWKWKAILPQQIMGAVYTLFCLHQQVPLHNNRTFSTSRYQKDHALVHAILAALERSRYSTAEKFQTVIYAESAIV